MVKDNNNKIATRSKSTRGPAWFSTRRTVMRLWKQMWPNHIYMYQVLQRNLGRFFAEWARPMERESRI